MTGLKLEQNRLFSLKLVKKIILLLVIVFIFDFFLFPVPVLANESAENQESANISGEEDANNKIELNSSEPDITNNLPPNNNWQVKKIGHYTITAYNSEVGQCDSTPCITANGFNLCQHGIEDTIATNFLAFGTRVKIPEIFGDKVFIVRDRMNSRYQNRLDVWMLEKQNAKEFGVKIAKIEVLE